MSAVVPIVACSRVLSMSWIFPRIFGKVLKLLSRRPGDPPSDEDAAQVAEPSSSTGPAREHITIDVLPDHIPWAPTSPSTSSSSLCSGPRPIRAIDNTVTFKCGAAMPSSSYSSARVYREGLLIHEERTTLELCSSSCMPNQWSADVDCTFLYSTRLVPSFWTVLCDSAGKLIAVFGVVHN